MNARLLLFIGLALVGVAVVFTVSLQSLGGPGSLPTAVTPTPAPDRLTRQLPAGQVAFVVRLDRTLDAGGAVQAGDRVDVLAFFSASVTGGEALTRSLVRDSLVLSSVRQSDVQAMTLAVTPDQAVLLQQAEQLGGRQFVVLRPTQGPAPKPSIEAFGDRDLESWLSGHSGGR